MRLKIPKADNMFVLSLKICTCFESIGLLGHVKMLVVADHLQNHSLMQSCAIPETAICFIVDCHVFNNETSFFFRFFRIFSTQKASINQNADLLQSTCSLTLDCNQQDR